MAVLEPIEVTITNYPAGKVEHFAIANNPTDSDSGTREVAFSGELYVERSDFAEVPPPKWQRLKAGGEVRLMGAYIIRCNEVVKNEAGEVVELRCTADLETGNGMPTDGRKVRGTIHWVSCAHAVDGTAMLYSNLFTKENLGDWEEGENYLDYVNPDSLQKLEAALARVKAGERFQLVRMGYFCTDTRREDTFNRVVTLKDSFQV